MSNGTWKEAIAQLTPLVGPPTSEQRELASVANLPLKRGVPRLVAAAQLRDSLSNALHIRRYLRAPAPESMLNVIVELLEGGRSPSPNSLEEASAWIEHLFIKRRIRALNTVRPVSGDIVVTGDGAHAEVASVGANGRVYFTGGRGRGSWPDEVTMVARAQDTSKEADRARVSARNAAASTRPASEWSYTRAEDLGAFSVTRRALDAEFLAFEAVINSAEDERPIQRFLTDSPEVLAALLRRDECYVIPQKRLGSEHVPDFIVGDIDSAGVHWHLIELESPRAKMFTDDGRSFAKQARKGIEQIADWREWLHGNIAYARTSRSQNGLGLFDIRSDAPGLVIVGRRATLTNKNEAQRNHLLASHTEIHTYDWLLERARWSATFSGAPAANPHALARQI